MDSDDSALREVVEVEGHIIDSPILAKVLDMIVNLGGRPVENPEMDCGLVILPDGRVRTVPMHRVRHDDRIVIGHSGVRVQAPSRTQGTSWRISMGR